MLPAAAQRASGFNSAWTQLLRDHLLNLIHSRPAFPSAATPPISLYLHYTCTHIDTQPPIHTRRHLHPRALLSSVTSSGITHLRKVGERSKVRYPRLVTLVWSSGPAKLASFDWLPLYLPSEVTLLLLWCHRGLFIRTSSQAQLQHVVHNSPLNKHQGCWPLLYSLFPSPSSSSEDPQKRYQITQYKLDKKES